MKQGAYLAILLAVFGSVSAPAQLRRRDLANKVQGVPPVLRRAIAASAKLRFSGRRLVTVVRDGQRDQHEEIVLRDGPRTRIEFPSGGQYAGQVIVENAKERRHFLPASNEVRILPPRREEGIERLRRLARSGKVTTEPGGKVAGVSTVEVLASDAAGNPIQRLSIDPNSGLVLRRRVYDDTGVEVGGFVFTKIDLTPEPFAAALFRLDRRGAQVTTPWDLLNRLAKRNDFAAVGIPASTGFRLDAVRVAKLVEGGVLVQIYIGPGGRLSLYQLRAPVDPAVLRRQSRGTVRTLSWTSDSRTFVLVGPQDDATLARLKGAVGRERG